MSDDIIDDIVNSKRIVVNRGKNNNMLSDEWETTRVIDFNQNFETISKRGKNIAGSWNESWFNNDQG